MTRYESKGTWFDPAEAAKRKRRWAGMVVSVDPGDPTCVGVWIQDASFPAHPHMVNGKPVCHCGALATFSGRCNFHQKADRPMTQPNQTKVEVPFTRAASTVDPHGVLITTPAGATINAEQAAKAYDSVKMADEQNAHGWKAAEDNARVGMVDLRERDEARAQVLRLENYIVDTEPRTPNKPAPFTGTVQGLVDGVSKAMKDYLPMAITHVIRTERSSDVPLDTIEVVIREPSGFSSKAPAPAVTKDTVVTLGMLQCLYNEAREERTQRTGYQPAKSPMHVVIDRKLAGK